MQTYFNYANALAIVADNPFGKDFLEKNRARLEQLGTEVGQAALIEILDLFATGKNLDAWKKFYNRESSWADLASGAAEDVTGTAGMAGRWASLKDFLLEGGAIATKMLFALLVAGFLG